MALAPQGEPKFFCFASSGHDLHLVRMLKLMSLLLLGSFLVGALNVTAAESKPDESFRWQTEQFADLKILRYQVPGFDSLPLQHKRLLYYLSQSALSGRDIIYDQNYKHNLSIRRTLEAINQSYNGQRTGDKWQAFEVYLKRVWFSNGIHHHYSTKKFLPEFDREYLDHLLASSNPKSLPLEEGESVSDLGKRLGPFIFDPEIDAKRVNKDAGVDLIADSANNYYENVSQVDVEAFYEKMKGDGDSRPISYGLNSKLIKEDGVVYEKTWKIGGMYSDAIVQIVHWLEKAVQVAENVEQRRSLELLIAFYRTGQLRTFDHYSIAWVNDVDSHVDVINGFIEVYGDAAGYRGAFESVVSIRDPEASKRIAAISDAAQWFEDHSSILDNHKKADVRGISAKVINVVMESGDSSPATPIGINLPNANWIRSEHGSKSVNLANIVHAYDEASKSSGMLEEFAGTAEEIELSEKWGGLSHNLHVDMHEVIGHASGTINPGVGTPKETLKSYASTLEEARADLVALFFAMHPKLIEMGLMTTLDVGKEAYQSYLRGGLLSQLQRVESGENIEEDHMRNRQLICKWVMEKGADRNVVAFEKRNGKTYVVINDYSALTALFGELLQEIQRIKSEGDYAAGKALVENYGVKVDQALHEEVLARVKALGIAPYSGFINPRLVPVVNDKGEITDVKVEYPDDFSKQHLGYSKDYSFLPTYN